MKISAFVVAAALVLAFASVGAASAAPQTGYDITFDGYCDGLHLNIPSVGLPGTAYSVDGDQIGCASGGVFGTAKASANGHYGVEKGTEFVTIPGFSTHTFIDSNHKWVHYGLDGNKIYVLNKGTWSLGTPDAGSGVPSSSPRPGLAGSTAGPRDGTKDIIFDGYCDGMELIAPSAGLGVPRTVDGNRTGCSSDALMGSKSLIDGQEATYLVSFFADGVTWIQTAVFPDHTWIHYSVSGDQIYLLNSGTWSRGNPIAGGGRPSTG
jgi:hypothetical protein